MTQSISSTAPRKLGQSGIAVSPLAWGMWRLHGDEVGPADRLVRTALESGITLLDTADIYGTPFGAAETLLGRVLANDSALRPRMVLASKGGIVPGVPYDSSAAYLVAACEASLQRLRTDHLDLYQIHRPDQLAHPSEVAEALVRLHASGKIRAAGISNHTVAQTRALAAHLPFPLASLQPEFSPLTIAPLVDGVLDYALEAGPAVLAWSPLAGGTLAGTGTTNRERAVIAVLDKLAATHAVARDALVYAWIMAHPARPIPIIGSQTPARIAAASQALQVRLTRQEWYEVLTASRGAKLP